MRDAEGYEIKCYRIVYYVEIGIVAGGGISHWVGTTESYRFAHRKGAEALRDQWITEGKLQRMFWGELRPTTPYGVFRIRRSEEPVIEEE